MSDTPTPPTAADLRWCADRQWYDNHPGLRAALRAGADAMDERDRLLEKMDAAFTVVQHEKSMTKQAMEKLDAARDELARLRAERDCWEKLARAFDSLCVAYRIGGRASEKALSTIRAMKEKLKF